MGVAVRKQAAKPARTPRPHLRLVQPGRSRGPASAARTAPRAQAATASAARQAFVTFAVLVTAVALLGMGRVWLSVQAAEASVQASELRRDIKEERYEGDMLEIRQSALGSPSRIRAIAGAAMDMAPAEQVTYLELTPVRTAVRPDPVSGDAGARSAATKSAIASILDLAAGEAQVLLVGDVGLASAR